MSLYTNDEKEFLLVGRNFLNSLITETLGEELCLEGRVKSFTLNGVKRDFLFVKKRCVNDDI